MLNISVLIEDAEPSAEFACEHGLSLFLESGDSRILFDVGESGGFIQNAEKMGLNLGGVTEIVISHGHHDHGNGLAAALPYIARSKDGADLPPIICHPEARLARRFFVGPSEKYPDGWREVGIDQPSLRAMEKWPMRFSREPLKLREHIIFLGEIPRKYPELTALVGETADGAGGFEKDRLADDTALVYVTAQGLIVVAGCSHSGIVNILEWAKEVTGVKCIRALFGGLHFRDMPEAAIERSVAYLRECNINTLWAAHCTDYDLSRLPGHVRLFSGQKHSLP